jgi:catechol 2,3-dioxygenase-like lactoylglutathione lyase family enzyme
MPGVPGDRLSFCLTMEPSLSFVTLGVADLERATRFYRDALGLPQVKSPAEVSFFALGPTRLALYPRHLLAADAGVPAEGSGFPGFALAHNVRSPAEVDRLLAAAAAGGGRIVKPGQPTVWGGYAGYFADPDGFLWEVAWNPKLAAGQNPPLAPPPPN